MDFEPIETQEQFDAAIKSRLAREREKARAELDGYVGTEPPLPPRMRQGRLFAFASGLYQRENPRISQMVRTWRFCRISKNKSAGSELTQHAAP